MAVCVTWEFVSSGHPNVNFNFECFYWSYCSIVGYLCELIEQQNSSTNTQFADNAFLLRLPPSRRNCADTFWAFLSLWDTMIMNGTSSMNVSDAWPTLTCLISNKNGVIFTLFWYFKLYIYLRILIWSF